MDTNNARWPNLITSVVLVGVCVIAIAVMAPIMIKMVKSQSLLSLWSFLRPTGRVERAQSTPTYEEVMIPDVYAV